MSDQVDVTNLSTGARSLLKLSVERAKGDPTTTHERTLKLVAIIHEMREILPPDVRRIEIDIEYADGGRVKLEGRA
jgi:hypothetical protein